MACIFILESIEERRDFQIIWFSIDVTCTSFSIKLIIGLIFLCRNFKKKNRRNHFLLKSFFLSRTWYFRRTSEARVLKSNEWPDTIFLQVEKHFLGIKFKVPFNWKSRSYWLKSHMHLIGLNFRSFYPVVFGCSFLDSALLFWFL